MRVNPRERRTGGRERAGVSGHPSVEVAVWVFAAFAAPPVPAVEHVRSLEQPDVAAFVDERGQATDAWIGDAPALLRAWRDTLPPPAVCASVTAPSAPSSSDVPGWARPQPPRFEGLPPWMENVDDAVELGRGQRLVVRRWDGASVVERVDGEGRVDRLGIASWGRITFGTPDQGRVEVTTSGLEGKATFVVTETGVEVVERTVCPVEVHTVRVRVDDGEHVPVTLVRAAGPAPGPDAPLWVDVYGGFGVGRYAHEVADGEWVRGGGWWATVHVRGGDERGRAWHDASEGVHKVRAALDLNSAVAGLHALGVGTPARTAAWGESNGGLVVAAAVARAPGLYGAVVSSVGPHDLVEARALARPSPAFAATAGSILAWPPPHASARGWWAGPEYPRPWIAAEREAATALSPVYTTPAGPLPPVYLLTGERDPVVNPVHSVRLAAAWSEVPGGPVLLRVRGETHGPTFPTCGWGWGHSQEALREEARAFVLVALGLDRRWPSLRK